MRLLDEVQRASVAGLSRDDLLAAFLNLYHLLLLRGFVARGRHLCEMSEEERRGFFSETTMVNPTALARCS
jgi:hypothetical protein